MCSIDKVSHNLYKEFPESCWRFIFLGSESSPDAASCAALALRIHVPAPTWPPLRLYPEALVSLRSGGAEMLSLTLASAVEYREVCYRHKGEIPQNTKHAKLDRMKKGCQPLFSNCP